MSSYMYAETDLPSRQAPPWDDPRGLGCELWQRHALSTRLGTGRLAQPVTRLHSHLMQRRSSLLNRLLRRGETEMGAFFGSFDFPLFAYHAAGNRAALEAGKGADFGGSMQGTQSLAGSLHVYPAVSKGNGSRLFNPSLTRRVFGKSEPTITSFAAAGAFVASLPEPTRRHVPFRRFPRGSVPPAPQLPESGLRFQPLLSAAAASARRTDGRETTHDTVPATVTVVPAPPSSPMAGPTAQSIGQEGEEQHPDAAELPQQIHSGKSSPSARLWSAIFRRVWQCGLPHQVGPLSGPVQSPLRRLLSPAWLDIRRGAPDAAALPGLAREPGDTAAVALSSAAGGGIIANSIVPGGGFTEGEGMATLQPGPVGLYWRPVPVLGGSRGIRLSRKLQLTASSLHQALDDGYAEARDRWLLPLARRSFPNSVFPKSVGTDALAFPVMAADKPLPKFQTRLRDLHPATPMRVYGPLLRRVMINAGPIKGGEPGRASLAPVAPLPFAPFLSPAAEGPRQMTVAGQRRLWRSEAPVLRDAGREVGFLVGDSHAPLASPRIGLSGLRLTSPGLGDERVLRRVTAGSVDQRDFSSASSIPFTVEPPYGGVSTAKSVSQGDRSRASSASVPMEPLYGRVRPSLPPVSGQRDLRLSSFKGTIGSSAALVPAIAATIIRPFALPTGIQRGRLRRKANVLLLRQPLAADGVTISLSQASAPLLPPLANGVPWLNRQYGEVPSPFPSAPFLSPAAEGPRQMTVAEQRRLWRSEAPALGNVGGESGLRDSRVQRSRMAASTRRSLPISESPISTATPEAGFPTIDTRVSLLEEPVGYASYLVLDRKLQKSVGWAKQSVPIIAPRSIDEHGADVPLPIQLQHTEQRFSARLYLRRTNLLGRAEPTPRESLTRESPRPWQKLAIPSPAVRPGAAFTPAWKGELPQILQRMPSTSYGIPVDPLGLPQQMPLALPLIGKAHPAVATDSSVSTRDIPIQTSPQSIPGQNLGPPAAATSRTGQPLTTAAPAAGGPATQLELDDLVEKIWHKLLRKLSVEQERRGWQRWP